jgi:diguanylate cyclase (GGDEF)-like protein
MHGRLASLLFAVALCLVLPARAADGFSEALAEAERVRSSDPARLEALLGQLNRDIAQATPLQREMVEYLKIYRLAYTGRFDLAIEAAKPLFERTQDIGIKYRVGSLIVNAYAATRDFPAGLRYLDQTLALAPQIADHDLRHHGVTAAAIIYNQVGQYELGLSYADQVLTDRNSPRIACYTGYARLEALYFLGRLEGEEAAINGLIDKCAEAKEPLGGYFLRGYLARLWSHRGENDRAIQMLENQLPGIEATRYPRLIGEIHSLLAEIKLAAGDPGAETNARAAIAQSAGIQHSLPLVTAHRVLYESALARKDTEMALEQLAAYSAADKAYLDDVKAREMAFQIVRHETQQKIQTIELLNKRNQVLQLEQKVAAQSARNTQLLIALLVVLLASIAYWAYKVKRLQVSLRRLAETDTLTGISNRHHFSRRAEAALEYCQRSGEPAALVMFDLDEFKGINDVHGHAMGDWVLQQVAAVCTASCRKNDLFGRLGGEEFAFLLLGADVAAGLQLARECRERISAIDTGSTGARFRVTASFGVAASANVGYNFHALLARADEAMYRAKREGRDRISLHTPDIVASSATV